MPNREITWKMTDLNNINERVQKNNSNIVKPVSKPVESTIVDNNTGSIYDRNWIRGKRNQQSKGYHDVDSFLTYVQNNGDSEEARLLMQNGFYTPSAEDPTTGTLNIDEIRTMLSNQGIKGNLGRRDSKRLGNVLTTLKDQSTNGTEANHRFMENAVQQYNNAGYAGVANLPKSVRYDRNLVGSDGTKGQFVIDDLDKFVGQNSQQSTTQQQQTYKPSLQYLTNLLWVKQNPATSFSLKGQNQNNFITTLLNSLSNNNFTTAEDFFNYRMNHLTAGKNGSKLNYMTQKYQQGGAAPQGDPQQQIIQLVQAAMQGDQQATAQIQQIMQAAQQGDQQAAQIAEMIMQVMNQMQGGAPEQGGGAPVAARNGAKLNYIKKLKGECPDGYEMKYFKAGGKVCKKCQKKVEKACGGKQLAKCGTKFHRAGGVMEGILSEMFAKGGAMNRNKHTAFGEEKGANVVSTNHAGRWGGRKAFNERGTHNLNPHDKPNKFTAFGDEGKKKPTNVGLVGHKATGKTGRMQNKQKAGVTYKATAFGGEKQKRFHRGAKASSIGRIGSISGYPKGQGGKSGIGRMSIGGLLPKKNN